MTQRVDRRGLEYFYAFWYILFIRRKQVVLDFQPINPVEDRFCFRFTLCVIRYKIHDFFYGLRAIFYWSGRKNIIIRIDESNPNPRIKIIRSIRSQFVDSH